MYIRKIVLLTAMLGAFIGLAFVYSIYTTIFSSNTLFNNDQATIYIATGATFTDVKEQLSYLLSDMDSFIALAERKGYITNVRPGKYVLTKGMSNNDIVNTLRSRNTPVTLTFNNQEALEKLAGRVSNQIEADSISLIEAFKDKAFLDKYGFSDETAISMYLPNSYEIFWNTSAESFRDRMLKEYNRFWDAPRVRKADSLNLTKNQVITLASIVHEESKKRDEQPRVAGVYVNRLRKNMFLQADPTVIYAIKKHTGRYDTIIKRVLYKDLRIESPYNTYKNTGLPPGPIAMPDVSAIDAVLNYEKHDYYYFVADTNNFGYHKFAKTLSQHNANKRQYTNWLNSQQILR
ncbi:endolytic transglycosylase MltG [Leptobacterium sp. I13]|uniref:endolytic transglycosylase MltG n=1 Tax=Leptobacterium meishanense TaxID=3128904 RepID=UPI0030EC7B72